MKMNVLDAARQFWGGFKCQFGKGLVGGRVDLRLGRFGLGARWGTDSGL
jgi:hypothetical protein